MESRSCQENNTGFQYYHQQVTLHSVTEVSRIGKIFASYDYLLGFCL